MTKIRLYLLVITLAATGHAWVAYNYLSGGVGKSDSLEVCYFKNVTGFPCPSCGSTRSIMYLLSGDWISALHFNPLGIILTVLLIALPIWIFHDWIKGKSSFFNFFIMIENVVKKKWVALPLTALVIVNWIWNFHKDL